MTDEIYILIGVVFSLVVFSGFFSGSETAITAANRARLHKLAKEGNKKARLVLKLREDKDSLIGTILLGNNAVNIIASMLAGLVANELFEGGLGLAIGTGIMTFLVLIFGEVMPKTLAFYNSDKIAVAVAPILNILIKIFRPITLLVQAISNFLLKLLGLQKTGSEMEGVDELRGAIHMHHSEGSVIKDDRDMLDSILDLSQIEVEEIMVHRRDMTTIDINEDPKKIIAQVSKSPHTRLPMWEDSEENIIGIFNIRSILKIDRDKPTTQQIRDELHDVQFVPETTTLRDQLDIFRKKRHHMGIVVDEYGALMGLVTLEDILEEIVGQIDDEHDKVIRGLKKNSDNSHTVRGNLSIRDVNRELGWELPSEGDASTIAGLVINVAEKIPDVGEMFKFENYEFSVLAKVRNQITSVKVKKL